MKRKASQKLGIEAIVKIAVRVNQSSHPPFFLADQMPIEKLMTIIMTNAVTAKSNVVSKR